MKKTTYISPSIMVMDLLASDLLIDSINQVNDDGNVDVGGSGEEGDDPWDDAAAKRLSIWD